MRKYLGFTDPVIPASYSLELNKLMAERGVSEERLLAGSDVSSTMLRSPKVRLSFEQLLRLIRNSLQLTGDPALGLHFGRRIAVSSLGAVGWAMMTQANLRGALQIAETYQRLIVPFATLRAVVDEQSAAVRIEPDIPLGEYRTFVMEATLGCLTGLARFLIGYLPPGCTARLDYAAPGHAASYVEVLGVPVAFGCERLELAVALHALEIPLVHGCEPTARMAEELCEREFAPLLGQDGVVQKVRSLLHTEPDRFSSVRVLAKVLQTSERSLRRALSAHGTSYQELRDEVRMRSALQLLRSTKRSVDEVARSVGFASTRSFRRALRRWTGHSPSVIRAEADA